MFNKFALFTLTLAAFAVAYGSGHDGFSYEPSLSKLPASTPSAPHTLPTVHPHAGHKGGKARRLGRGQKDGSHKSGHGGNNGGLGLLGRSHNGSKGSGSGAPSNGPVESPGPVKKPGSSQPDPVDEAAGVVGGVSKSLTRRDDTETELTCTAGSLTCCMSASTTTDFGTRQLLASMNIDTKKLVGPYIGTLCRDTDMDGTQCLDDLQPLCCEDYYANGTAVNCIDPRNISGDDD
ncbi:hypothetical protein F5I97DRAFT_1926953 [Phlebopus sp. FC_14]|nr:hypothetical protein F5I97DRAFT_1926953 [Phlebopus sp. FC_14]